MSQEIHDSIVPTLGRHVLYFPSADEREDMLGEKTGALTAIIAWVNDDKTVNLNVLASHGDSRPRQNVPLIYLAEGERPEVGFCAWPPHVIDGVRRGREMQAAWASVEKEDKNPPATEAPVETAPPPPAPEPAKAAPAPAAADVPL